MNIIKSQFSHPFLSPSFFLSDYEAASSKAGKVENEVKRLHTLIVDINSHKLKAQQDKLDKVNKELDDCSSTITKAQVAIKTADRWGSDARLCPAITCVCIVYTS